MTRTALVRIDRYSWRAIWLHWSIAVLVLVQFGARRSERLGRKACSAMPVPHIAAALCQHFLLRVAVLGRMARD
jgi:cytochrome b561